MPIVLRPEEVRAGLAGRRAVLLAEVVWAVTPSQTESGDDVNPTDDGVESLRSNARIDPSGLRYGVDGLIPAVVRDARDGAVLMLAWMNRASLERTLDVGRTVFWSRSRGELWEKGATSGHVQRVIDIETDCDADALLITVEQTGVACHTGERTCFHQKVEA
jgi:phosphoribosyl-AMP cyclohydrolase